MNNELSTLSAGDVERLAMLEITVSVGLRRFLEVGEALSAIREEKLYRGTHGTFEDYCRERWKMTDRRARQLMVAAEIGTIVPVLTTESQARELARVPAEQREQVVSAAVAATGGKLTAASIRQAAIPAAVAPAKAQTSSEPLTREETAKLAEIIEMTPAPAKAAKVAAAPAAARSEAAPVSASIAAPSAPVPAAAPAPSRNALECGREAVAALRRIRRNDPDEGRAFLMVWEYIEAVRAGQETGSE